MARFNVTARRRLSVKALTDKDKAAALKGAATTVTPTGCSEGVRILIANLELEFPATARKQSFGEDSNRKYSAILHLARKSRLALGCSLACPEERTATHHSPLPNRLSRQLEFRANH
jgi:hypothetical protein